MNGLSNYESYAAAIGKNGEEKWVPAWNVPDDRRANLTLNANETEWSENLDMIYVPPKNESLRIFDRSTYVFWAGTTRVWCK